MDNIEDDIRYKLSKGYIDENLQPIKCKCGCKEFYDKCTDTIDYLVVAVKT